MKRKVIFIVFSLLVAFSLILSSCNSIEADGVNGEEDNADVEETVMEVEEAEVEETEVKEAEVEETEVEETEVEEVNETEFAEPMTLHLVAGAEVDTLDPHKTAASVSQTIMSLLGSSLIEISPEGNIIPSLAESWEVSEDGMTYTFHLREDVVFHNGTPLTAQDFVYTYERAIDPETASPSAGPRLGTAVDFKATDDFTFVITLAEPFYPFLSSIAVPGYLQPLSQSYVEEMGDELGRNPVGVGPYKLVEWVTGDHILLEKNPDFVWGPEEYGSGPYLIDYIEFQFITEAATTIAGLEAGEISISDIDAKDLSLFEGLGFDIIKTPALGLNPYIAFNTQSPLLDNLNIRIALNKGIDRQIALILLEQGNGLIQYGPLSSSQIGYWSGVEDYGYPYDPEGAKALIEEAGYELNVDGIYEKDGETLSFELYTIAAESTIKVAEVIQSMLVEIGVEINIIQEDQGVLIPMVLGGDYQMTVLGISNPEADILYRMFHSSMIGGLNYAYVDNPELDEMLELTRTLVDPNERQQAVNDVQKYIAEQAYFIPLYSPFSYMAVNPSVHDYIVNPYTGINYTKAYIESE